MSRKRRIVEWIAKKNRIFNYFFRIQQIVGLRRRKQYYFLLVIMFLVGITESVSALWVASYASLLADSGSIETNSVITMIQKVISFSIAGNRNVILIVGAAIMALLIAFKNILRGISFYYTSKYSAAIESRFGELVVDAYVGRPYEWFLTKDPAKLQQIGSFRHNVGNFLIEILRLISDAIIVIFLFATIAFYKPVVTIPLIVFLGTLGLLLYSLNKKKLDKVNGLLYQRTVNAFGELRTIIQGYKDIRISGVEAGFRNRFVNQTELSIPLMAKRTLLANASALYMETLGFFALSAIIVIVFMFLDTSSGEALSLMAILGVTAWRVLPALLRFFTGQSNLRTHFPAIQAILDEISSSEYAVETSTNKVIPAIKPFNKIILNRVSYKYPQAGTFSLKSVSFSINSREKIGIIGTSGSGKTTLVDVISGLLKPTSGTIMLDDKPLEEYSHQQWAKDLAYLPQSVHVVNGGLDENVAFGVDSGDIDQEGVRMACKHATLEAIWERFSDGEEAVGDQGKNLSGGQAQRLGIARLVYRGAELWIIDEGTGSLDFETENKILDNLFAIAINKTLIMITHRLESVTRCDKVLWLADGALVDFNTPEVIIKKIGDSVNLSSIDKR